VFTVATLVGLVHGFDDALVNRQPGVPLGQHAWAIGVTSLAVVVALLGFPRLRPGFRAALSVSFGVLAATNGAMHVVAASTHGLHDSDATGILAALAGIVLVLLGLAIPFVHRGEGPQTPRRRWRNRAIAVVALPLVVFYGLAPFAVGIGQTHKFREVIAQPPAFEHRDVSFTSSDGLRLSGWYAPSRNGAAVLLVNTAGGDRNGSRSHAALLASHGYGVLLYDARGTGRSQGSPNGYGWNWGRDVSGALAFLGRQPDVDAQRIGGLGLSTGADVLLETAADDERLRAVVTDGATGRSIADLPPGWSLDRPSLGLLFTAVRLFSGEAPGPPLRSLVARIAPTPLLLIASDSLPAEPVMNRVYADAAREPVELWAPSPMRHTAGIRERRAEYERRVIGFLDDALLR
jgi:fermentation-respiration switch protein FrsA (DUF1100 family)/uncharacterized membrane protein HdeD (DUF308 family)